VNHAFDPAAKTLSIEIGDGDRLVVKPDAIGLRAEIKGNRRFRHLFVIPGEYELAPVSAFLAREIGADATAISDLLLETEIWYARGFLGKPRNFPPEIFAALSVDEFTAAGVKNYKSWFRAVFYRGTPFRNVDPERIEKNVRDGVYPEKLHSIRYWNEIPLRDLRYAVRTGAWKRPEWGVFASQYYQRYAAMLDRHPETWTEIDAVMQAAIRFPKTDRTSRLFDDVYREGGTLRAALRCRTVRELAAYVEVLRERRHDASRRVRLTGYRPPDVPLPPQWSWASRQTFWDLGERFNCCINANGAYAKLLEARAGAVAYRNPHLERDDPGALALFVKDGGGWQVQQIAGWSNGGVAPADREHAAAILSALNRARNAKAGAKDSRI